MYREGLARFSTETYSNPSKKNQNNLFIHLTNYAVNKKHPNFQQNKNLNEDGIGHKRSISSIFKYMESIGCDINTILIKIKQIIVKTVCSVQPYLLHFYNSSRPSKENLNLAFELLGYVLAQLNNIKLNPWLLEVNHAPSFQTDSPLDLCIKKYLLMDTFILLGVNNLEKKTYKKYKVNNQKATQKIKQIRSDNQEKLELFQQKNLNGYQQIFPNENDELKTQYFEYMETAKGIWDEFAGPKKTIKLQTALQPPERTQQQANIIITTKENNNNNLKIQKEQFGINQTSSKDLKAKIYKEQSENSKIIKKQIVNICSNKKQNQKEKKEEKSSDSIKFHLYSNNQANTFTNYQPLAKRSLKKRETISTLQSDNNYANDNSNKELQENKNSQNNQEFQKQIQYKSSNHSIQKLLKNIPTKSISNIQNNLELVSNYQQFSTTNICYFKQNHNECHINPMLSKTQYRPASAMIHSNQNFAFASQHSMQKVIKGSAFTKKKINLKSAQNKFPSIENFNSNQKTKLSTKAVNNSNPMFNKQFSIMKEKQQKIKNIKKQLLLVGNKCQSFQHQISYNKQIELLQNQFEKFLFNCTNFIYQSNV